MNYRDSVERTALFLNEKGFTVSWFLEDWSSVSVKHSPVLQWLYRFLSVQSGFSRTGHSDVDNIIHHHLPETEDSYVHRDILARLGHVGSVLLPVVGRIPAYYVGKEHLISRIRRPAPYSYGYDIYR